MAPADKSKYGPWPRWLDGWIATWLATALQVIILFAIVGPLMGAIMPPDPTTGVESPLAGVAGVIVPLLPFVHLVLLPIFAYRKFLFYKQPPPPLEATVLDPDAKTVIWAAKLSCKDKVISLVFGLILGLVSIILTILSYAGLDLRGAWFPEPFFAFYKAKITLRSLQIDGCKMRFEARQEDAYLKFQYEAMMNFYTLGFFAKCCGKKTSYTRWLDGKIKWKGTPPPGFNQQFRVFHTKLTCVQKIKKALLLMLLSPFYSSSKIPFIGGFIPTSVIGLFADMMVCKWTLSNFLFGGSKPYFGEKFTFCNYVYAYYVLAIFGICGAKLKKWIDSCILMGTPTFDAEFEADAIPDEPTPGAAAVSDSSSTSTTAAAAGAPPVPVAQTDSSVSA